MHNNEILQEPTTCCRNLGSRMGSVLDKLQNVEGTLSCQSSYASYLYLSLFLTYINNISKNKFNLFSFEITRHHASACLIYSLPLLLLSFKSTATVNCQAAPKRIFNFFVVLPFFLVLTKLFLEHLYAVIQI